MDNLTLAARQSLTLAHIDEALARWQQRPKPVTPTTITPIEVLRILRSRMIAKNVRVIRWIDLNRWQRHALSILYNNRAVGNAWPGLPPG